MIILFAVESLFTSNDTKPFFQEEWGFRRDRLGEILSHFSRIIRSENRSLDKKFICCLVSRTTVILWPLLVGNVLSPAPKLFSREDKVWSLAKSFTTWGDKVFSNVLSVTKVFVRDYSFTLSSIVSFIASQSWQTLCSNECCCTTPTPEEEFVCQRSFLNSTSFASSTHASVCHEPSIYFLGVFHPWFRQQM